MPSKPVAGPATVPSLSQAILQAPVAVPVPWKGNLDSTGKYSSDGYNVNPKYDAGVHVTDGEGVAPPVNPNKSFECDADGSQVVNYVPTAISVEDSPGFCTGIRRTVNLRGVISVFLVGSCITCVVYSIIIYVYMEISDTVNFNLT